MNRQQRRAAARQSSMPQAVVPMLREAMLLHRDGNAAEAEAAYRRILAIHPTNHEALLFLGVIAVLAGRAAEALELLDQAVATNDSSHAAHLHHGDALFMLARLPEALADYDRAIALNDSFSEAHLQRALLLVRMQRLAEAEAGFDRAIALRPDMAEAYVHRGAMLSDQDRPVEALADYDRALALQPRMALAFCKRAATLAAQFRLGEAMASVEQALAIDPELPEATLWRGVILSRLNRPEEAMLSIRAAMAKVPGDALLALGYAQWQFGQLQEAMVSFDAALAVAPDISQARFNRGLLNLLLGNYAEAWPDYEARWDTVRQGKYRRHYAQPQWQGEELAGRSIMVHGEQGFGDVIQFCRFVPLVASRGGVVTVNVRPELVPLLQTLPGAPNVVADDTELPPFDLHCPLMSLPLAFGTTLETIPTPHAYLFADPERVARWAPRLAERPGPRVGLVWAGIVAPVVDPLRSMRFAALRALAETDVALYALQREVPGPDRTALAATPAMVNLGPEFADWADTAAVIAQLDLVIAIDTAVAHLAAAMGKPTWVMLRSVPDWRWHTVGREGCPWYPTARTFLQPEAGDWASVGAQVREALDVFAQAWWAERGETPPPRPAAASEPIPASAADAQLRAIFADLMAGRVIEAEMAARDVLTADPWNSEATHMLGLVAMQTGRLPDADSLFARALAADPYRADFLNSHGLLLSAMGRHDDALARFNEVVALSPEFAEGHCNRGNTLRDLGRMDDALASYARAVALRPGYADAWSNHAITLVDLGRAEEALESIDHALAADADNPAPHCNRGIALHTLGRLEEALPSFDRAVALAPEEPEPWQRRSALLTDMGRLDAALADIERALALVPGEPTLEAQLQAVLDRRGGA